MKIPARKIFVIAQVTASMALLVASGLLGRTLWGIETMDPGFNCRQNTVLLDIEVNQQGPRRLATLATLVERMKTMPGVTSASMARVVPFSDSGGGATKVVLSPNEAASPTAGTKVWFNQVDDVYFRLMGVGMVEGRAFGRQDTSESVRVVVVNRTPARKLFSDGSAIGRHVRIGRDNPIDAEIIGVAQDGKYSDLTEAPQPYLYLPLTQDAMTEVTLIVTTAGDPKALLPMTRKAVRQVDPSILIETAMTLDDHMSFATHGNRMEAYLTACLGGLALLLTTVGLYGVISYTVSRRTHEIGIRMALGAVRSTVLRQIVKEGLKPVFIGIAVGTILALFLGRAMSGLLYGVRPADPLTLLGTVGLMIAISTIALIGPVRRALRIEPMDALRED